MPYPIRNPRLIIGGRDYSDLIKSGNIVVGPLVSAEAAVSQTAHPTWLDVSIFGVAYEEQVCACGCGSRRQRQRLPKGGFGPWQLCPADEKAQDGVFLRSIGIAPAGS